MLRIATLLIFALGLAACDVLSTLTDGFKYAKAVENELEISTGVKPDVGFNWKNGKLLSVTVIFPQLYEAKPLRELAGSVRASVSKQFRQTPNHIVLGFALENSGVTAQAQ
ncbi:MAG: hypothetical protein ACXWJW_02345 [Xanthobacteraceae bacterium]